MASKSKKKGSETDKDPVFLRRGLIEDIVRKFIADTDKCDPGYDWDYDELRIVLDRWVDNPTLHRILHSHIELFEHYGYKVWKNEVWMRALKREIHIGARTQVRCSRDNLLTLVFMLLDPENKGDRKARNNKGHAWAEVENTQPKVVSNKRPIRKENIQDAQEDSQIPA